VNLANIAAKDGNPNHSAYSVSKAAAIALTKSLGKELATLAHVVAPAAESPMSAGTNPATFVRSRSLTPMGRMGRLPQHPRDRTVSNPIGHARDNGRSIECIEPYRLSFFV
jgi:NAD(P)-dependent dehydrogenase (short-subunit alcohol dehydrogenase family)